MSTMNVPGPVLALALQALQAPLLLDPVALVKRKVSTIIVDLAMAKLLATLTTRSRTWKMTVRRTSTSPMSREAIVLSMPPMLVGNARKPRQQMMNTY